MDNENVDFEQIDEPAFLIGCCFIAVAYLMWCFPL